MVEQARGFPVDRDMKLTLLTRLCPEDVRRQVRWTQSYQSHDYEAVRKLVRN